MSIYFKNNQTIEIHKSNHHSKMALWNTYRKIDELLEGDALIKSQTIGNFDIIVK